MTIKEHRKLIPGELHLIEGEELEVKEVYSHWVLFQMVDEPYLKRTYTNVDLLFKYHIYTRDDVEKGVII